MTKFLKSFSRTTGLISTKLGKKHPRVKGFKFVQVKGPALFQEKLIAVVDGVFGAILVAGLLLYLFLLVYCNTSFCWCIAIPIVSGVLQYLLLLTIMYCCTCSSWCIALLVAAGVLQYPLLLVYYKTCCWCIAVLVVADVLQYLLTVVYCNSRCCWCVAVPVT